MRKCLPEIAVSCRILPGKRIERAEGRTYMVDFFYSQFVNDQN